MILTVRVKHTFVNISGYPLQDPEGVALMHFPITKAKQEVARAVTAAFFRGLPQKVCNAYFSTGNDRYSGHGYSGIDRFSGTKNPHDAILFTVSGITAIVEQKFRKFRGFFGKF